MMSNNEGASFFVRVVFCVVDRVRDTLSSLFEFGRIVVELEAFLTAPSSLFRVFFGPFTCFSQKSRRLSSREKRSATSTGRRRDLCVIVIRSISSKRCINGDDVMRRRRRRRRDDDEEENFFLFCLSLPSVIFLEEERKKKFLSRTKK